MHHPFAHTGQWLHHLGETLKEEFIELTHLGFLHPHPVKQEHPVHENHHHHHHHYMPVVAFCFTFSWFAGTQDAEALPQAPSIARYQHDSQIKVKPAKRFVTGTGFFINKKHIVTNNHVVKSCANISIGTSFADAKLHKADFFNDLAVLTSSTTSPAAIPIRASENVKIGEAVTMIGYPGKAGVFGHRQQKQAVVRHTQNSLQGVENIHFNNVAINGNSGGPLLDESGYALGVVAKKMGSYIQTSQLTKTKKAYKMVRSSVAISHNRLKTFLDKNKIRYHTSQTMRSHGIGGLDEAIVNIRCSVKS